MLLEIKLKYYNSAEKMGFNSWREIYDCVGKRWIKADYHLGRIVYGPNRIPYSKIKKGIDINDFQAQQYCPFLTTKNKIWKRLQVMKPPQVRPFCS